MLTAVPRGRDDGSSGTHDTAARRPARPLYVESMTLPPKGQSAIACLLCDQNLRGQRKVGRGQNSRRRRKKVQQTKQSPLACSRRATRESIRVSLTPGTQNKTIDLRIARVRCHCRNRDRLTPEGVWAGR